LANQTWAPERFRTVRLIRTTDSDYRCPRAIPVRPCLPRRGRMWAAGGAGVALPWRIGTSGFRPMPPLAVGTRPGQSARPQKGRFGTQVIGGTLRTEPGRASSWEGPKTRSRRSSPDEPRGGSDGYGFMAELQGCDQVCTDVSGRGQTSLSVHPSLDSGHPSVDAPAAVLVDREWPIGRGTHE
jgi:hypothetical protein